MLPNQRGQLGLAYRAVRSSLCYSHPITEDVLCFSKFIGNRRIVVLDGVLRILAGVLFFCLIYKKYPFIAPNAIDAFIQKTPMVAKVVASICVVSGVFQILSHYEIM